MVDDLSTVSGRLRSLLGDDERHRMSIRSFAAEMRSLEPRPPGSARTMIHRYLREDGPEPSLAFLTPAARILGVEVAWLAFGDGPRTNEEAIRRERVDRSAFASISHEEGYNRYREGLKVRSAVLASLQGPGIHMHPTRYMPSWVPAVVEASGRLGVEPRAIGEALAALLARLNARPGNLDDFILAAMPVLLSLERVAPEQPTSVDTTEES